MLRLEPRQTYDKHIIGTARDFKGVVIFVYDEDSIIDMLADEFKEDKTQEEDPYIQAVDYFEFNIRGAYLGEHTPVFVCKSNIQMLEGIK